MFPAFCISIIVCLATGHNHGQCSQFEEILMFKSHSSLFLSWLSVLCLWNLKRYKLGCVKVGFDTEFDRECSVADPHYSHPLSQWQH